MKSKNKKGKVIQDGVTTQLHAPIIFELSAIAGLFFDEDGIQQLFEEDLIQIGETSTKDNERANIIIGLTILDGDYFELKFVITTTRGIERLTIYDQIDNLNSFQLKKWMHIVLCDEMRKISLITDFPEHYSFDYSLFLA